MLSVPKRYVRALTKVAKLPDGVVNEISTSLSRLAPVADIRDVVSAIICPSSNQSELTEVVSLLVSLHAVREDDSAETFVTELSRAMELSEFEELHFVPAVKKTLNERLIALLNLDAFAVSAKAIDLRREYENTFCRARILTDARPIYGKDAGKKPSAALLTHTLKLSYHHAGNLEHFYVVMTEAEITQLRDLLKRADEKAQSLRQSVDEAHIPVVSPHQEQ